MSIIEKILEHFLGHKYYTVIYNSPLTRYVNLSSFIFPTKREAEKHFEEMVYTNRSCLPMEIVSFRSRNHYRMTYNGNARSAECYRHCELPEKVRRDYPEGEE